MRFVPLAPIALVLSLQSLPTRADEPAAVAAPDNESPTILGDFYAVASAPGYLGFASTTTAHRSALLRAGVPLLSPLVARVVAQTSGGFSEPEPPNPPLTTEPPPPNKGGVPASAWILSGAGVVSFGTAGVLMLIGASKWSQSQSNGNCVAASRWCSDAGHSLQAQAKSLADASADLLLIGGVLLITGVTIWIADGSSKEAPKTGLVLAPGGVSVIGKF